MIIVTARRHLLSHRNKNKYLACVIDREVNKLIRVGKEVLPSKNTDGNEN